MFEGFSRRDVEANGVRIHFRIGGDGPPLLLLHGHPQTHVIWHLVAPRLAEDFTVVAADLRGYGDSAKPPATPDHRHYRKEVMAADQVQLMRHLGFDRFSVLAHDRGARVAYRMALDAPEAIERMSLLDVIPTIEMYEQTSEAFARLYWHWFFLIRPAPWPEECIARDPEAYLRSVTRRRSAGLEGFDPEAAAEYARCLALDGAATGICEDYRASAGPDLEAERADREAGRKITCPLQVLWGENGAIEQCFDPLASWSRWATQVEGRSLPCGHYIPEEQPLLLLDLAREFLTRR